MKRHTQKILSYVAIVIVVIAASVWIFSQFYHGCNVEFTDNAQIERRIVPVNSRVSGYIREIRFKEFSQVKKGDTLVIIDDADMRLGLARARADYRNALAGRSVADRSVGVAAANMAVSDAAIAEAKVLMDNAAVDLERYRTLMAREAVTRQQFDGAETDYNAKKARYEMLSRQKSASSTVVTETRQRISQSDAAIDLAEAMVAMAELNLSYTVITAPCDGFTSRKDIQEGQLVQPGQTLLDIVDSSEVWVIANFKETQLSHIAEGSEVTVEVDALPSKEFTGRVAAISTATGDALSIIPQDNSAGNFVKVRRRIPVKIELTTADPSDLDLLRAGMNVECKVKY